MNRRITISVLVLGSAITAGCGQRLLDYYNNHDDAGVHKVPDLAGADLAGVDMAGDMAGEDMSGVFPPDMKQGDMEPEGDLRQSPDLEPLCLALDLPGSGAIVTAGPNPSGDYYSPSTVPLTVEAWVYQTSRSSTEPEVVVAHTGNAGGNSLGYQLSIDTSGHVVFTDEFIGLMGLGSSLQSATATSATGDTVPLNAWTHIVGEVQPIPTSGTMLPAAPVTVWLNGVQSGTGTSELFASGHNQISEPLSIGGLTAASGSDPMSFTGYVHDVRISDVARYSSTFTPEVTLPADADTLALFHFEDAIGSQNLLDSSSHTVNGTATSINAAPASGAAIGTPPVCQ